MNLKNLVVAALTGVVLLYMALGMIFSMPEYRPSRKAGEQHPYIKTDVSVSYRGVTVTLYEDGEVRAVTRGTTHRNDAILLVRVDRGLSATSIASIAESLIKGIHTYYGNIITHAYIDIYERERLVSCLPVLVQMYEGREREIERELEYTYGPFLQAW